MRGGLTDILVSLQSVTPTDSTLLHCYLSLIPNVSESNLAFVFTMDWIKREYIFLVHFLLYTLYDCKGWDLIFLWKSKSWTGLSGRQK